MAAAYDKYSVTQYSVSSILGYIEAGDIAIPEIQRPFVWKNKQVRDLLDSLYKGFPTGYIIIWKNHGVKLKDGTVSKGQKIMIDGQQRITALMTAIAGIEVINSDYKKGRVKIAFDPFAALSLDENEDAVVFEVQDQSHIKSKRWIEDISIFFAPGFSSFNFINKYVQENPDMSPDDLNEVIGRVKEIGNRHIGVIELSDDLDIDDCAQIHQMLKDEFPENVVLLANEHILKGMSIIRKSDVSIFDDIDTDELFETINKEYKKC